MRYSRTTYNRAVRHYTESLRGIRGRNVLVAGSIENRDAYFSLAPLSQAASELGKDISIILYGRDSPMLQALEKVWLLNNSLGKGRELLPGAEELQAFIAEAGKKAGKNFRRLFDKPEIMLEAADKGFIGTAKLGYKAGWMKEYRQKTLKKTCATILKQVLNLKKKEMMAVGFIVMPKHKEQDKPLQDFLDSYAICWEMKEAAVPLCRDVSMGASSQRPGMSQPMNRISDLRATLLGCALTESGEPVFRRFRALSRYIGALKDALKPASASFHIHAKGYPGKHMFGDAIGYPSPGGKTRWPGPGGFIYQLDHSPQTLLDPRKPLSRVSFTETLPIDVFIETSNIDWFKMARRDRKLISIANRCESFIVKSGISERHRTVFEAGIVKPDGSNRRARGSDTETRSPTNKDFYKRTGKFAGTMANIPGGEMFITPESVKGTIVGDVVISIDQSYRLSARSPFVIRAGGARYRVLEAPKGILEKFNKKKRDAWKNILLQEKTGSVPKKITSLKKENFNRIGEFAINTNPKARLCDYLIVNEKIANMIHVAMGAGFEADRATEYHTDVVIDARRQKLDIYGIEKKTGKHVWVLRRGRFVV